MQDSLQDADLLIHSSLSEEFNQQTTPELTSNIMNTQFTYLDDRRERELRHMQLDSELL